MRCVYCFLIGFNMLLVGMLTAQIPSLPTDWERLELSGMPKIIQEFDGENEKTWEAFFNPKGNLETEKIWDANGVLTDWTYSYDAEGKRSQTICISPNAQFLYKYAYANKQIVVTKYALQDTNRVVATAVYDFDIDNKLLEKTVQDSAKFEKIKYNYTQSKKPQLLSETYYDKNNVIIDQLLYTYNPKGELLSKYWQAINLEGATKYNEERLYRNAKQERRYISTHWESCDSVYKYNAKNLLIQSQSIMPDGQFTIETYEYDQKNRLVQKTMPEEIEIFQYNDLDSVVHYEMRRPDKKNPSIDYVYVNLKEYSKQGALLKEQEVRKSEYSILLDTTTTTYIYNWSDSSKPLLLEKWRNGTKEEAYSYVLDKKKRISKIKVWFGERREVDNYTYYENNKVKTWSHRGYFRHKTWYNEQGLVTKYKDYTNDKEVVVYKYNLNNKIIQENQLIKYKKREYVYNNYYYYNKAGLLEKEVKENPNNSELEGQNKKIYIMEYTHNAKGLLVEKNTRVNGRLIREEHYTYNESDSLVLLKSYVDFFAKEDFTIRMEDAEKDKYGNWLNTYKRMYRARREYPHRTRKFTYFPAVTSPQPKK